MSENLLVNNTEKVRFGCFYTTQNIFGYPHFQEWFANALKVSNNLVLEPFAGSNNLIKMLQEERYNFEFVAYDVNPGSSEVEKKDTIKTFPRGYKLIITNLPYLAKKLLNSVAIFAKFSGLGEPVENFFSSWENSL